MFLVAGWRVHSALHFSKVEAEIPQFVPETLFA